MTDIDSRAAVRHFLSAYADAPNGTAIEVFGTDKVLTVGHLRDLVGRTPQTRPADVSTAVETLIAWIRNQTGPEPHDSEDLLIHQGDEAATCPACLYQRRLGEVITAAATILAELADQDADTRAVAEAWSYFADDDAPPRGMRQLYDMFADRIEALDDFDPDPDAGRPQKSISIGTGMPATTHLEAFGQCLRDAFGTMPYHVGSSIHGKTWRDVDVRIMLDDDRFDALFPGYSGYRQRDAWWALLCAAISELGKQRTGLPIDFQVQRTSEANEKFPSARNPLFVGHADENHRPTMKEVPRA